jgi:hypothetical protein
MTTGRMIFGDIALVCETPPCTKCGGHDYAETILSVSVTTIDAPIGSGVEREWRCAFCDTPVRGDESSGTPG